MIFGALVVAQAVATTFNISYNVVHITPLLNEAQSNAFQLTILLYNGIVFPVLVFFWFRVVFSLASTRRLEDDPESIQRRAVALPWWGTVLSGLGWIFAIPVLCLGILSAGGEVDRHVWFHLPVAILTAMVIGVSLGYLSIDWLRTRHLFPFFFSDTSPARIRGGMALSVTGRGILWILSSSIGPMIALLMLLVSPSPTAENVWFAITVAAAGSGFAIWGALLLRRLVADPVREISQAAQRVGKGEKNIRIDNLYADEFGVLADEFNEMVAGLREKERIEETFGRHVGREVAAELLKNEQDLEGVEREVSVLFSDIRGFTTRCEYLAPRDAVRLLNEFHAEMTAVIEGNGGIVTSIMGDGFMSIFGATGSDPHFADSAVRAGRKMLEVLPDLNRRLETLGFEPIHIGVGINTGLAVVGPVGSPRRLEYSAIGDIVNTAARIESMTKELGVPFLVSESTWTQLTEDCVGEKLEPQEIRGRKVPLVLYAVGSPDN